ncbi:hypothetical protein NQ314_008326 [Rhamnusium bicolor]|uniref:Uncharacterized protein n=1 Tax=Rhamnusium bicolor TaxID=1586634 RepID=A0AAV8YD90_9CUCU|nr:hypothetical protein NQ314_008326 [Rhamnusium bicolor]
MGDKLSDVFLQLFCEKNSDGTKHLRLKGKDLYQRIGLDLSYNDIGDEGMEILAQNYLHEQNNLKHLNLMHCDIGPEGMKFLSSSDFLMLETCRINGNKLGPSGARHIGSLINRCPTLLHIDIAETDLTLDSIESILIVIEGSTLKILDISRIIPKSYYTKYDPATLADDLAVVLKHLEMLDLGCNNMGDFGIQLIAIWLKSRPPLRALVVSGNNIKDYGARALGFGLPFSKIRYLDISNNKIDDMGLMDLLDTIKKSSQLRLLYLWGNTFGPISCKGLPDNEPPRNQILLVCRNCGPATIVQ